jgi:hypothetical protein
MLPMQSALAFGAYMANLYQSKRWLEMQVRAGKKPDDIAKICNTDRATIYRWMLKHGIRR